MRKSFKRLTLLMALLMVFAFLPGCGGGDEEELVVPAEIQALADQAMKIAQHYALELEGPWGDMHVELIDSGLGEDYTHFEEMREVLNGFIEDSGAKYVYAMYPLDITDSSAPFFITVDGSHDPDDYGAEYELELPFIKAWYGIAASSSYAWEDIWEGSYCWSAYAPIHDSDGEIVAILGVDCYAPEIEDFPEWNIDSDEWNELEEW